MTETLDVYVTKKNKIKLDLVPVDALALQQILYRTGAQPGASRGDIEKNLVEQTVEESTRTAKAISQLFGYCLGQGITTNTPDQFLEELEAMGFSSENKNVERINWLKHIELDGQEEAGELVGKIAAITFSSSRNVQRDEVNQEENKPEKKRKRGR
jgi:hypothetical protein